MRCPFSIAEIKSAQGAFARARIAVSDDDKFLPLCTLGLQPRSLPSRQVRRVCLLGYDSFKTQTASLGKHFSAITFNVFAVKKSGCPLRFVQQCLQCFLAFPQRQLG
jgi:hypothetical protein